MSFKATLPYLEVGWSEPANPANGTWAQYNVYRQQYGDAATIRIATVTTHSQTSYDDYAAPSKDPLVYTVTQSVWSNGALVESAVASITTALHFENAFLHDVSDPTRYVQFREDAITIVRLGDVTYQKVAGRPTPVALIGESSWRTFAISNVAVDIDSRQFRRDLELLWARQVTNGSVFCLRIGYSADRSFVAMDDGPQFADGLTTYKPTLKLTEVYFPEAV